MFFYFLIGGIILMSIITFFVLRGNYQRESQYRFDISDRFLLTLSILLGGPGLLVGMLVYKYKTESVLYWLTSAIGIGLDIYLLIHFAIRVFAS